MIIKMKPSLSILIFMVSAYSQEPMGADRGSPIDRPVAVVAPALLEDFEYRNTIYAVSHWGTAVGLAAALAIPVFDLPPSYDAIASVGYMTYMVGIPLMGLQANRMMRTMASINGEQYAKRGWGYFWCGKALQIAGVAVITVGFLGDVLLAAGGGEVPEDFFIIGALTYAAGFPLDMIAWYKFAQVRKNALHKKARIVPLHPALQFSPKEKKAGLSLAYHF